MSRTIIYPPAATPSDFPEKLVKYVPAEVLAFYTSLYPVAVAKDNKDAQLFLFALGVIGTVGYLYIRADRKEPPRCYFYFFGALAFVGWALGTSSLWQLFNFPDLVNQMALPVTIFLVPLLDELAGIVVPQRFQRRCPQFPNQPPAVKARE